MRILRGCGDCWDGKALTSARVGRELVLGWCSGLPKALNQGRVFESYGCIDVDIDIRPNRGIVLKPYRDSDNFGYIPELRASGGSGRSPNMLLREGGSQYGPKIRSTLGFRNLHYSSVDIQNCGLYFL